MIKKPVAILAICGLSAPVVGQGGPLAEPFPDVIDLGDLLPPSGDGTLGFGLQGAGESDLSGYAVASAGDLNNDGIEDFIIGTNQGGDYPETDPGVAYIVFGRHSDTSPPFGTIDLGDPLARWGFRFEGTEEWPGVGRSVAAAGDVNGDGLDDVIIGAAGISRYERQGGRGAAFVIFGRDSTEGESFPNVLTPDDLDGSNGFRLEGWSLFYSPSPTFFWHSQAGWTVAGVGDINGDGADDVAVGTLAGPTIDERTAGTTCVVFGRPSAAGFAFGPVHRLDLLDGQRGFRMTGSGRAVAGAGDINGDGFDDVLIGKWNILGQEYCYTTYYCVSVGSGRAYVLFGRDDSTHPFERTFELESLRGGKGFQLDSRKFDGRVGTAASAAGDVNGDGLDDILIGAPGTAISDYYARPSYDHGEAYVVFGRDIASANPFPDHVDLAALNGSDGFAVRGRYSLGSCGQALTAAGDVNNDGIDDMLIASPGSEFAVRGEVALVYGRDTTGGAAFPAAIETVDIGGDIGFRIVGHDDNGAAGRSVANVGDVNADGVDDMLIGAPFVDRAGVRSVGESYVLYGRNPPRPCRPDLDDDGALTIFDFLEFQNLFDAGDPRADFDGDGELTLFDFLAFQNAFDAGCL
ncbi:MAG: GC-type dockerin domain-anchored protein [Phycisphaerales bacterium JB060]